MLYTRLHQRRLEFLIAFDIFLGKRIFDIGQKWMILAKFDVILDQLLCC